MNLGEFEFVEQLVESEAFTPMAKRVRVPVSPYTERKPGVLSTIPELRDDFDRLDEYLVEGKNLLRFFAPELAKRFSVSPAACSYNKRAKELQLQWCASGITPTSELVLPADLEFSGEENPSEISEDLRLRVFLHYEYFLRVGTEPISGICSLDFTAYALYDPFEFKEEVGVPGPAEKCRIVLTLSKIMVEITPDLRLYQMYCPDENNAFRWSDMRNSLGRVDINIAQSVDPDEVARLIMFQELWLKRKLLPVLIEGGMKSGKSAALLSVFRLWPVRATRAAFTFGDEPVIESRNGGLICCTKIKKFSDINLSKIRRSNCNFPMLLAIEEVQFGDPESLGFLLAEAELYNAKVVMAGIPVNLEQKVWPVCGRFKEFHTRVLLRLFSSCEICRQVTPNMTAQLRHRPTQICLSDMRLKKQWISCCHVCAVRYFPYCEVVLPDEFVEKVEDNYWHSVGSNSYGVHK